MIQIPPEALDYIPAQRSQCNSIESYIESVQKDFDLIKPHLVEGSVLDIGCGLGALSVLMQKHCGGKLWLLDGDGPTSGVYSKHPTSDPYNSMSLTRQVMDLNGVKDYEFLPIGCEDLPEVDNCVSLLSWGWHYPLSTYSPRAKVIIVDIRQESVEPKVVISTDCEGVRRKGRRCVIGLG